MMNEESKMMIGTSGAQQSPCGLLLRIIIHHFTFIIPSDSAARNRARRSPVGPGLYSS